MVYVFKLYALVFNGSRNGIRVNTVSYTHLDVYKRQVSGLDTALKVLKRIDDIGFCYLTSSDVVRHPLVQKIVQAYETYEQKNTPPAGRRRIRERN